MVSVLDAVLVLPAVSVNLPAAIFVLTVHCALGITVHLYTVLLTTVNHVTVPFVAVISPTTKFAVASLAVHVTTKLAPLR